MKNFSRKPIVRITLVLSILALAGVVALAAAGSHHGISLSQDGRFSIATQGGPSHITAWHEPDTSLSVIAGNLSKYPEGVYFCCYGFTISGPQSFLGAAYWAAVPFTPTANATVHVIEASVAWGQNGTEGVTLSLNADSNGVPGAALATGNVTTLGDFGYCCTVAAVRDSAGIPVTAGTQYWVVASTSSEFATTYDAWAFNSTNMTYSTYGFYSSTSGTWSTGSFVLPGYQVLGTTN